MRLKRVSLFLSLLIIIGVLTGCSGEQKEDGTQKNVELTTVRLGIFKNVTHAPGYIALEKGYFRKYFGDKVKIDVISFENGSDLSLALATDQIDLGFVGAGPSSSLFIKSKNFRVVSGSNEGGAVLVARSDTTIQTVKDLVGKTVAIPSKGNTNDISLRALLAQENLKVSTDETGVQIIARAPSDTMLAFRQKEVDAALIPEPWGTLMVKEGLAKVVLDWQKIPPNNGRYPQTVLVASDKLIKEHRNIVQGAVQANKDAIDFIKENPEESYVMINSQLKKHTGKNLEIELIKSAIAHLHLTTNINEEAIEEMAKISIDNRFIKGVKKEELDLKAFIDDSFLRALK